jgi:hypothetical protein
MTPEERHAKQRRLEELDLLLGIAGPTEIDDEADVLELQEEEQVSLIEELSQEEA